MATARMRLQPDQPFTPDWLAAREPLDARARSRALARRFAAMLPPRPHLLDLGAGTGSLFRWLAPIVAGDQHWVWFDYDRPLLRHGLHMTERWARRLGYGVQRAGRDRLVLATPRGVWSVTVQPGALDAPNALPLSGVHAVTCSALLDLFTREWLVRLLTALHSRPLYAAVNVTGQDRIWPPLPDDAMLWRGYLANQTGWDGSKALGPGVAPAMRSIAAAIGRSCTVARSDWAIHPGDRAALHHMLRFIGGAARQSLVRHQRRIGGWEQQRHRHLATHRLAMRIGHVDLLVGPGRKE